VVQIVSVSVTYDITSVLEPPPSLGVVLGVGMGLAADGEIAWVTPITFVGLPDAGGDGSTFGELGTLMGVAMGAVGGFDEATGGFAEVTGGLAEETGAGAGAGAASLDPHPVIGLSPGSFESEPNITSSMGDEMTQLSAGSLTPPMRPGHLSMPSLPESQLSMIC
jgi:hypothetical protein